MNTTRYEEFVKRQRAAQPPHIRAFSEVVAEAFKREREALEANGGRSKYAVIAYREGSWVMVSVPMLDILTQAENVEGVESQARDAISLTIDKEPDSFDLDIDYSRVN